MQRHFQKMEFVIYMERVCSVSLPWLFTWSFAKDQFLDQEGHSQLKLQYSLEHKKDRQIAQKIP